VLGGVVRGKHSCARARSFPNSGAPDLSPARNVRFAQLAWLQDVWFYLRLHREPQCAWARRVLRRREQRGERVQREAADTACSARSRSLASSVGEIPGCRWRPRRSLATLAAQPRLRGSRQSLHRRRGLRSGEGTIYGRASHAGAPWPFPQVGASVKHDPASRTGQATRGKSASRLVDTEGSAAEAR